MAVTKPNRGALTLEKIRAALPTHIPLTPGVHKLRVGDEEGYEDRIEESDYWMRIDESFVGLPVLSELYRRPIPPHILDNQAFWIWRGDEQEYPTAAELAEVGGIDSWRAQIIAGRLYDKWLLEQMENV